MKSASSDSVLGSARASRVGNGAFAIANFSRRQKRLFRRGAETSTRGARAPQQSEQPLSMIADLHYALSEEPNDE